MFGIAIDEMIFIVVTELSMNLNLSLCSCSHIFLFWVDFLLCLCISVNPLTSLWPPISLQTTRELQMIKQTEPSQMYIEE